MDPVARIPFRVPVDHGVVRGDVRVPWARRSDAGEGLLPDAALVVCHGFKGFKDWGFFPAASEEFATRLGCPVISINFSGSGIGPDLGTFSDPEAFAANTFSREVSDLETVLDGILEGRLGEARLPPPSRLGLVGHSRGAIAAVLVGCRRPEARAVTVWAGLARPQRYAGMFPEVAEPGQAVEVRNARTGEVLLLRRDVVDDLRENAGTLDPVAALNGHDLPLLVIHGGRDEAVPLDDARMYVAAGRAAELALIESTGHTFDVRHPYVGSTPALERAISRTVAHFHTHLAREP